jgi:hypothetical protein
MSDFADRLERELLAAGGRSYQRRARRRLRRPGTGALAMFASAAVTAAVVALVFVTGVVGGHGPPAHRPVATPTPAPSQRCGSHGRPAPGGGGAPTALLSRLAVLRHGGRRTVLHSFISDAYDTLHIYLRYVRTVPGPDGIRFQLVPVVDCSLPRGYVGRGQSRAIPQEHLLVRVSGRAVGSPRWLDAGNVLQIAGGYAFSGFYLRDHHWLQLVLAGDEVARVKLRLDQAGRPTRYRIVPARENVAAAIVGVDDGPTIITSYGPHGRSLHYEYVPNHDCLTHHTTQACLA